MLAPTDINEARRIGNTIYQFFSNQLVKDGFFDWFEASTVYTKLGNAPGIYPDTLLFLIRLIRHFNLDTIIEYGSGFSTLYFAELARQDHRHFYSFEEEEKYRILTERLLAHYSLSQDIKIMSGKEFPVHSADLVFLDCSIDARLDFFDHYPAFDQEQEEKRPKIKFLCIDDAEAISESIMEALGDEFRQNQGFYVYNGGARVNRILCVAYPNEDKFLDFLYEKMHYF